MRASESHRQADLFAASAEKPPLFAYTLPDEILAFRRPEAQQMLEMVQKAETFPWKNLTVATCEEMRFNGMVRLFPPAEARPMLEAFAQEIIRLYALIEEPWIPLYHAVLQVNYSDAA
jgi:hypothetical protein